MANRTCTSGAISRPSSSSSSSSMDYYEETWPEFHERMQSDARARTAARMNRTVDTIIGAIEARVAEREQAQLFQQQFQQQRAAFEGVVWWLASGNGSGETFVESDEWTEEERKARPEKAGRRGGMVRLRKWCGALKETARKVKERLEDWREQRKFDKMPLSKIAGLIETGELRREDLVERDC